VHARDVLLSKVGLQVVVCGIPALFAGIVCIAALPVIGFAQIALTLILPLSVTLMFSLLGITLNLVFPRFDWINPIQPVKQGASCMLTFFGGMALIAVLVVVFMLLPGSAVAILPYGTVALLPGGTNPLETYLLICAIGFIAASAGLYVYLIAKGCRKFETL
jgi:ABC-2 type transport system permease protein